MAGRVALGLVALGVAIAGAVAPPTSEASCIAIVEWGGAEYIGTQPPRGRTVEFGGGLGRARVPACIDTSPSPPDERDTFARIRRIRGVPPALGVFGVRDRLVYLARGYFPHLLSHPLHSPLFGGLDTFGGARCGRPRRVRGAIVRINSLASFTLRPKGRRLLLIEVSSRTQIRGFLRHGHPYLQPGHRVLVVWQRCTLRDGAPLRGAIEVAPA
jgi:hypothetical protein